MSSSSASSSLKALSKIASNRLQKELVEWQVNPPSGFKHKVTDNLQRWVIEVNGAPGTLYANETYQLQVDFPEHYPMEAPQHSSMLSSATAKQCPEDNDRYVRNCRNGRSPKQTRWWFHDDKV
ncbi:Ubiquitin-conjugating enzyme 15 [Hibiscus syriacus]|uniref:Ubiquitin-conjugating enzyme 15 n=1 Tax=Hibiscus syriacus TaxID=106335 RepID=A0A6A3AWD5_HIBSY|nr:Ubiquitin-conjugating enzyme 15 [Hibiscus syriacus]